ncbi:MAG: hypothetical protein ACRELB_06645 [Polyangiaceae bacterium]
MTFPPIWIIALVCAALAPWAVRALAAYFEARVRRRTLAFLQQIPPRAAALPQEKRDEDHQA